MDDIRYEACKDGMTSISVKGEHRGYFKIDDLSKVHIGDCLICNVKGKPPGSCYGLCLVYVDDLSKPDVIPPFKDNDEIKCIKRSIEMWHDGTSSDNCFCTEGNIYIVNYCIWSPRCGWLVFINYEFHLACDFELVKD